LLDLVEEPFNQVPRAIQIRAEHTLLREAEEEVDLARATGEVPLDSVFVIEKAMQHFYTRAEMGKNAGRKQSEVDADYEKAAHLAALAAPYRHARLSAMKLAGNPNNPARFKDDATADELREEIMRRLGVLHEAGVIDLKALPVPGGGIANQPAPGVDHRASAGSDFLRSLVRTVSKPLGPQ